MAPKAEPCTVVPVLVPRSPGVWTVEGSMNYCGTLPIRMTILSLDSGEPPSNPQRQLLVVSPLAYSEELVRLVQTLGTIKFVMAPNTMHHLWAGQWAEQLPGAALLAPAALSAKRPDLAITHPLPAAAPIPGIDPSIISFYYVPGYLDEVPVLHHPSRTLVITDTAYNFTPGETQLPGAPLSWGLKLIGGCPCCSLTFIDKWAFLQDAASMQAALEQLLGADWDALIMAHGSPLPTGGKQALRQGTLAWVSRIAAARAKVQSAGPRKLRGAVAACG